jgi:hypothetical protein
MKVSTRRKHPKRKFMFLYLDLNENENGGLYTYKTPKTEMMLFVSFVYIQVSTRRTPKTEKGGVYTYKTP